MSPSLVYLGMRIRCCGLGLKGLDECAAYFIWVKERSCDHLLARSTSFQFCSITYMPLQQYWSHICVCIVVEKAAFRYSVGTF